MDNLINFVANDFARTMFEEGFDSFKEMKTTYGWNTEDIKDEVRHLLYISGFGCLSDDGLLITNSNDETITYRSFIMKASKRARDLRYEKEDEKRSNKTLKMIYGVHIYLKGINYFFKLYEDADCIQYIKYGTRDFRKLSECPIKRIEMF